LKRAIAPDVYLAAAMDAMKILVLNAGSSSQKACLFEIADSLPSQPPPPLWEAQIDWTHQQGVAELKVKTAHGASLNQEKPFDSKTEAIHYLLDTLWQGETQVIEKLEAIDAVGHRVVHGGQTYQDSVRITAEVKDAIADLIPLAPAHNPANLEGIHAIESGLGTDLPQVAVFDTAFHSQIPDAAAVYPGPYEWAEQGIRRYGFHGISHQYCTQRAMQILNRDSLRLITCHLGNGCSLAAVQDGKSINTTMGFTPLEGLMMGSRSGSVDPGILIHLMRQQHCTADELNQLLNKQSGLKGISGISNDMRQVTEAMQQGNDRARLAFEMFVHRLRSQIGAMMASLAGVDALVFTAGIGEHAAAVRSAACDGFEFLGLKLNEEQNQSSPQDADIAKADSTVRVLVIHTREEWAIAQDCWRLCQS
jgi:acetate kinase